MDCDAIDIYPVGWAELVGHKLESPRPTQPLTTKKEKRKGGTGGKKGGTKKRSTTNLPSNNGNNHSTTAVGSVSPAASTQITPSLSSTSLSQQNGSRKTRRVVSPASDTSGVSTRTPTPPTASGNATNITVSTSSASSSPSSPSIITPSADFSEQPSVVSSTKSTSTVLESTKQNTLSHEELSIDKSKVVSLSMPTSPSSLTTDDLTVEPMTMEDKKEETQEQVKIIPRLVDSAGQAAMPRAKDINLNPSSWTVEEVAQFLQINECASLADAFQEKVMLVEP